MYEYLGRTADRFHFKVVGKDRWRLLKMYENKIITAKDLRYNWEFTNVSVFLKNPHNYIINESESYGLHIDSGGIAGMWPNQIPLYILHDCTDLRPSAETILMLGLKLPPNNLIADDEPDYLYEEQIPECDLVGKKSLGKTLRKPTIIKEVLYDDGHDDDGYDDDGHDDDGHETS